MKEPFWFDFGAYRIKLPPHAQINAKVHLPAEENLGWGFTNWAVQLGRFQLLAHLSADELNKLKEFIDYTTKSDVIMRSICINGIPGVTHGNYQSPRTWIDWWFRKGDTTLCLCLQSLSFPFVQPTDEEIAEHDMIITSLFHHGRA